MKRLLLLALAWAPLSAVAQMGQLVRYDTVADALAAKVYSASRGIVIDGYTTKGDGGGGLFYPVNNITSTNIGTKLASVGSPTWSLVRQYSGPLNVMWFGAKGDGVSADQVAFQAAINAAQAATISDSTMRQVLVPKGQYLINATLLIDYPIEIVGEGIEVNPVNLLSYDWKGSVLKSGIIDGSPVVKIRGYSSAGTYYAHSVHLRNLCIDGTGTDGDGIWLDLSTGTAGNAHDMQWKNIVARRLGGSGFRIGTGTLSTSPHLHYSVFEKLVGIECEKDTLWFASGNETPVNNVIRNCYSNGAGRYGFHFEGLGGAVFENLVENNSAQLEVGAGFRLHNIRGASFTGLTAEGSGRDDISGVSVDPLFDAQGILLDGVLASSFIGCKATSAAGVSGSAATGQWHARTSSAANGYGAVSTSGNVFLACEAKAFNITAAPNGALAGAGAGNVDNGIHFYRVTRLYNSGAWETPYTASHYVSVTVSDAASNGKVALTAIPTGVAIGGQTCSARKIYRTTAGTGTWKLLATINDNTTTAYTDNTADASLGVAAAGPQQVYFATGTSQNTFIGLRVNTTPSITDTSGKNVWLKTFNEGVAPGSQAEPGFGVYSGGDPFDVSSTVVAMGADNSDAFNGFSRQANVNKRLRLEVPHYSNGATKFLPLLIDSTSGNNTVNVGGGSSAAYAATLLAFYTGATTTTTTGTLVGQVSSAGKWTLGQVGVAFKFLRHGVSAAMVAGTTTVADANVSATTRIFCTTKTPGGTVGFPYVSARSAGVNFTITSTSAADTSTVDYLMLEP